MKEIKENYDQKILDWIVPGSSVLDLGCGSGALLMNLKLQRNVTGKGIEIAEDNIRTCIRKGLSVIHSDLNAGLQDYKSHSFDYIVMSRTLQIMENPNFILNEMLRVGNRAIINYPNFGYIINRLQFCFTGRMPKNKDFPYEWYNTPNIHFFTHKDFRILCEQENIQIEDECYTCNGKRIVTVLPNLLANEIYCLISRK